MKGEEGSARRSKIYYPEPRRLKYSQLKLHQSLPKTLSQLKLIALYTTSDNKQEYRLSIWRVPLPGPAPEAVPLVVRKI